MQSVGGELYSAQGSTFGPIFLLLPKEQPGLTLIAASENRQPLAVSDSPGMLRTLWINV